MSIFRRKPKFRVGDRVMVTSLYMGWDWLQCGAQDSFVASRDLFVGESDYIARYNPRSRLYRLDSGAYFYEWELRPA